MLIKSDHSGTASAKSTSAPTKCVNCGAEERRLLHHARHRGIFRRLCTNCVLRLHPESFCPTCFQVYPPTPSNDAILACCKCFSSSHSHCVTAPYPKPYICPLCANPNTPIFQLKQVKDGEDVDISNSEEFRVMDREAAKKLLAAAKIAMLSMNKAATAARAEAERRAKEAAIARKRAREALENVAYLVVKHKLRKREEAMGAPVSDVPGSGDYVKRENNVNIVNGGHWNGVVSTGVGLSVIADEKINVVVNVDRVDVPGSGDYLKRENNVNVVNSGHRNGNVVSPGAGPAVIIDEKMNVDRVESSNQVVTALGAVELKERENMGEPTVEDVGLGITMDDDHVLVMDVDDHGSTSVNARVDGGLVAERNIENDDAMFADGGNGEENLSKLEDINMDQMQCEVNGNGEEHANGSQ